VPSTGWATARRAESAACRRASRSPWPHDTIHAGDGDDYAEGGAGNDAIDGGAGQDDLVGGNSSLYLPTGAPRPDGIDTIHAGDGADVVAGDNANVYRLRGAAGYLSFAYDPTVVPRGIQLLDYSPRGDDRYSTNGDGSASPQTATIVTGTNTNIGAADFLHGGGGSDVIYGQTGDDALFGEAGDDDLYGNSGTDWLSGGAGDDGLLGDDGLIRTSRNGTAEPLYGLAATAQQLLSVNGDRQTLTVNIAGELKKVADLEPFFIGDNDVMYGGLGNDFLHGGAGDDAMSGAEPLALYDVADPLALLATLYAVRNVLEYSAATTTFRYYDANDPRRKVTLPGGQEFLLDHSAAYDDGKDVLFGDVGHDWMSGGTNEDHLYGGYGDDLLNGDDDLSTTGTDARTSGVTYADLVYGGAGRDVMIANTSSDRLYDWTGEFDTYVVPFSPNGAPTINRDPSPSVRAFLTAASLADGADPTRPAGSRHNEIGMADQASPDWGAQHGAPRDPQTAGHGSAARDTGSLGFSISVSSPAPATIASGSTTTVTSPAPTTIGSPPPAPAKKSR
jgi:Ca2+-binding RTX toxin-like protein